MSPINLNTPGRLLEAKPLGAEPMIGSVSAKPPIEKLTVMLIGHS